MSFQISFQKTNKDSKSKDRMVVRRYTYDKETQRSKAGKVIFSCHISKLPNDLPPHKIKAFDVTEDEQQQFSEAVQKAKLELHTDKVHVAIKDTSLSIIELTKALEERSDGVSLEELDCIENALADLRKQLTRHSRNEKHRLKKLEGQSEMFD